MEIIHPISKDLKYVVRRMSYVVCRLYLLSSYVSTLAHRISTFYYVAGRGDG
jgi:hypothetical protein